MIRSLLITSGSLVLVLVGIILFPLPIPFGAVLIVSGTALLVANNHRAREWVRRYRREHPGLDQKVRFFARYLPKFLRQLVHRTDP